MSNEKYFEYETDEAKAACELNRKRNRAVSLAAITSLMAITAVCSGCKSAEAKSEESLSESSSISASSMAEAVVASYDVKVEAGVSYTASDLGALVVDEQKVIPVSASTNSESSLIDSSSVESEEVTFEFKDGDTEKIFKELGEDKVSLIMTASDGTMEEWSLAVTVEDTTAPVFRGIKDISAGEGEELDLKAGVSVTDNYDKSIDFTAEIDPEDKTPEALGEHTVIYTAKDSSGNETTEKAKLTISKVFEEMDKNMYVKVDTLTAYTDRGMTAKGITLSKNDKVHVTAKVIGTNTYRIEVGDKTYFVDGTKLSSKKVEDTNEKDEGVSETNNNDENQTQDNNNGEDTEDNNNGGGNNGGGNNGGGESQNPTTSKPVTTQPPQTEPPKTTTTEPPKTTQPPQTTTQPPQTTQQQDEWIRGYGDMGWGFDAYYAYNPATGEYIILGYSEIP